MVCSLNCYYYIILYILSVKSFKNRKSQRLPMKQTCLARHGLYGMASTRDALLHCYASSSLPAAYKVDSLLKVLVLHHYQVT